MVGGAGETWSDAVILFEDKYENLSEDKYENLSEDKYEKDRIEMQQERSSYAVPPPWVGKSGTGKRALAKVPLADGMTMFSSRHLPITSPLWQINTMYENEIFFLL